MSEYRNWVRTYAGLLTSSSGTAGVAPALSLRCQKGAAGPGRPEGGRGSWALVSGESARRFSTSEPECPEGAEGMPPPAPGCSMRPAARRGGLGTVTSSSSSGSAVTCRGAAGATSRSRRVVARVLVPARLRPHAAALSSDPGLRTAALALRIVLAGSPPPTRSGCRGLPVRASPMVDGPLGGAKRRCARRGRGGAAPPGEPARGSQARPWSGGLARRTGH
jgi:hypothetical protein